MLRKVKKTKGCLFLTKNKKNKPWQQYQEFDSLYPERDGEALRRKVSELVLSGVSECLLVIDRGLPSAVYRELPCWLQQFKMQYAEMDFHMINARMR